MRKIYLIPLFILFAVVAMAQNKTTAKTSTLTPKKKDKGPQYTKWSIRAGANLSVVYLARNVKDKNNEPGYSAGAIYEVNNFIRISGLFSYFKGVDIPPTWVDVKATSSEVNLEMIARFPNQKTHLYPFVGLSYNTYKGLFTGRSDYLNLRQFYEPNTIVKSHWLGVNIGTGIEHDFGILGIYFDYRMRVGKQDKAFNIMDVSYTAGLKVRFPYGKLAKSISHMNDRFYWF